MFPTPRSPGANTPTGYDGAAADTGRVWFISRAAEAAVSAPSA
ncbi:hypothetical protein [Streptomyces sp. NPDC029003]